MRTINRVYATMKKARCIRGGGGEADHTTNHGGGREDDHTTNHGGGREDDHTTNHGGGREDDHISNHGGGREDDHTTNHGGGREDDHTTNHGGGREDDHISNRVGVSVVLAQKASHPLGSDVLMAGVTLAQQNSHSLLCVRTCVERRPAPRRHRQHYTDCVDNGMTI